MSDNELLLTGTEAKEISEALELFKSEGRRSAAICTDAATSELTKLLITEFARHGLPPPMIAECTLTASPAPGQDGLFIAVEDRAKLSASLTRLTRVRDMFIWAPRTPHYFTERPVFIQSVPKCGTHVLFECLAAFGFGRPASLDLPDFDSPFHNGVFYNLQHMPVSRLSAPLQHFPRFIDVLSRSVVVFIVRDPRDAAVSLAYYLAAQADYHITAALFRRMPASERLSRVIAGNYPIPIYLNRYRQFGGGIRELFQAHLVWWEGTFPNVWCLRFDDIVGPSGGGDGERQVQTVWGLQLALHVPGRPRDYCDRIFSKSALTFRRGQIGDYLTEFSAHHHALFGQSADGLLPALGYADRWKIAHAFSVRVAASHRLSATLCARLRAELATHGCGFSAVSIGEAAQEGTSGAVHLEVTARRLGEGTAEAPTVLAVTLGDARPDVMTEPGGGEAAMHSLRLDTDTPPQPAVETIIAALVHLRCIDEMPQSGALPALNSRFEGEIRLPVDSSAPPRFLYAYKNYNIVRAANLCIGIARDLGHIDVVSILSGGTSCPPAEKFIVADTASALEAAIDEKVRGTASASPQLLYASEGYNVVSFGNLYVAVAQDLGPIDVAAVLAGAVPRPEAAKFITAHDIGSLQAAIGGDVKGSV